MSTKVDLEKEFPPRVTAAVEEINAQVKHMNYLLENKNAYRCLSWDEEITRMWNRINEYREAQVEAGQEPCDKKRFTIGGF